MELKVGKISSKDLDIIKYLLESPTPINEARLF